VTWKRQSQAARGSCYPAAIIIPTCQRIFSQKILVRISRRLNQSPYLSAGHHNLHLTASSAHQLGKLGDNTRQKAQTVVLGEGAEEIFDRLALDARSLDELSNNGAFVGGAQRRGIKDADKLLVLLDEAAERGDGLGRGFEARSLDGCRVLHQGKSRTA